MLEWGRRGGIDLTAAAPWLRDGSEIEAVLFPSLLLRLRPILKPYLPVLGLYLACYNPVEQF